MKAKEDLQRQIQTESCKCDGDRVSRVLRGLRHQGHLGSRVNELRPAKVLESSSRFAGTL
jgi:hypothetical protein